VACLWLAVSADSVPTFTPKARFKYTRFDPLVGWVSESRIEVADVYGPGIGVTTNSRGLRGRRELADQVPPGKTRIVCLGDSFTFGYGVGDDDTYPQQLEALDPRLEVVNMGQGGYGVDQAYLWYQRDATFDHDILILALITDDLRRLTLSDFSGYPKPLLKLDGGILRAVNTPLTQPIERGPVEQSSELQRILSKLRLFQALGGTSYSRNKSEVALSESDWRVFEALLADLGETARKRRARLCVAYLPTSVIDYSSPRSDPHRGRIARFCAARGVPYIDVLEAYRKLATADDAAALISDAWKHCNKAGNLFVAETIYRQLRETGVLRDRPADSALPN
jgi:hypothetical protein